jgi:FAD/FMN-containing dehydrogenase
LHCRPAIHVEAGLTLAQLQQALLQNNQFLPLDPWNGPQATIGGITAANAQGPFRTVGSIRDWIIGMKVVHVDGRTSKTGGRVVKNVTGYDLAKLYTGSLGTLAIIVEVSLKLQARFARTASAAADFPDEAAAAAAIAAIQKSPVAPVSFVWKGPANSILLRFGEHPRAVGWQLEQLPGAGWRVLEGPEEAGLWEDLRREYAALGPLVVRVPALPGSLHEIIEIYGPTAWIAHAANGIVMMAFQNPADVARVRSAYRAILEKAPREARREIPAFALTGAEYEFARKLKAEFDPEGRLNPGRHVDGERK